MTEPVAPTVRCPHCASTDAAPARTLVARLAGMMEFRCGKCSEPFYARAIPASQPTPFVEPAAGERRRRKEAAKANANAMRDAQRMTDLQNDLAKAAAALAKEKSRSAAELASARKDFAAANEALAEQRARLARAEQEANGLRDELAASHTAVAAARERVADLEAQLAAIPAPVEGPRVDLEKMHLQGTAADLAEALAAERERVAELEAELSAARASSAQSVSPAGLDSLRAELARESERRTRLERDLKDMREAWIYDVARRRS